MSELIYEKELAYGSIYALQFTSDTDKVSISFDSKSEEVTVKGLKYKYLIKFSDVESVSFRGSGANGMFVIQTSGETNEIGIIDKAQFDAFAKEVNARSLNLKIEKN